MSHYSLIFRFIHRPFWGLLPFKSYQKIFFEREMGTFVQNIKWTIMHEKVNI